MKIFLILALLAVVGFFVIMQKKKGLEVPADAAPVSVAITTHAGLSDFADPALNPETKKEREPEPLDADALFSGMTPQTAAEALERLKQHPAEYGRRAGPFYRKWGNLAGEPAVLHAREHGGGQAVGLASMAVEGWASRHPEEAGSWVLEREDTRARAYYARGILKGRDRFDPESLQPWVGAFVESPYGEPVISQFANQWAAEDPYRSLGWVRESLPDGALRERVMEGAFILWGRTDPEAASGYLAEMEEGPDRDRAISAFSRSILQEDPEAALIWAGSIGDEEKRKDDRALLKKASQSKDDPLILPGS